MAIIRPATPADAPSLARLRYEFRSEVNVPIEAIDDFLQRCLPWMEARLRRATPWHCWVAEHDDRLVGCLWLYVLEKIPNPAPEAECHAYITSIYVQRDHRGGAGSALLQAAIEFAHDTGADSAFLWPTEESRSLYRRFGFMDTPNIMEAVITPGRDLH
jgi:GNAT superfamily N-acetyltransferase